MNHIKQEITLKIKKIYKRWDVKINKKINKHKKINFFVLGKWIKRRFFYI